MEKKKYEKIIISIILIIQTIIFIIVGANKSYIHMDEAYSLGLPSYAQAIDEKYKTKRFYFEEYKGMKVIRVRVPEVNKQSKVSRVKHIWWLIKKIAILLFVTIGVAVLSVNI